MMQGLPHAPCRLQHGILDVVKVKDVGHNALQIDFAGSNGIDRHGVNVAITEHGLEGQFLVQCKAHRQGHLAGFGVTNQNDVCALLNTVIKITF